MTLYLTASEVPEGSVTVSPGCSPPECHSGRSPHLFLVSSLAKEMLRGGFPYMEGVSAKLAGPTNPQGHLTSSLQVGLHPPLRAWSLSQRGTLRCVFLCLLGKVESLCLSLQGPGTHTRWKAKRKLPTHSSTHCPRSQQSFTCVLRSRAWSQKSRGWPGCVRPGHVVLDSASPPGAKGLI